MDWRTLSAHRSERGPKLYVAALQYGNCLWHRGYAARSILCLDRALGTDLVGTEPELRDWPLPYAALAWILAECPAGVFMGNPRVHFQHYADRMNEPRREQRRWRAWACWELSRLVLPELPADPKHQVQEPTREMISEQLARYGHHSEPLLWEESLVYAARLALERKSSVALESPGREDLSR